MTSPLTGFLFLAAAVGFIFSLQGLSTIKTALKGNAYGIVSMFLSVFVAFLILPSSLYFYVLVAMILGGALGGVIAIKTPMMALPQLMAAFHSLVGLAAVFVAAAALLAPQTFGFKDGIISWSRGFEMGLGTTVGALTFTGSLVAFLKLQGSPLLNSFKIKGSFARNFLTILWLISFIGFIWTPGLVTFLFMTVLGLALGFFLVLPIGGADMPVVVSMLNSYSGWAAAGIGFTLSNPLLIIVGALVGSSGAILSYVMCEGMNRPFLSVILGSSLAEESSLKEHTIKPFKQGSSDDAAFLLGNARHIMIVPGYGMAVSQAQHALKEMVDILKKNGAIVHFAIHPVAGRMPGHMNVLLAEAGVPYEDVKELEEINGDFPSTDVAFVIGANDITNPSAKTDTQSPLYGMPVLEVARSKTVLFVKRSMGAGYAGVDNPLFYQNNTFMLLGDGKKICEEIIKSLRDL
jgi:NAD(P) transhydrogenase subunit beta